MAINKIKNKMRIEVGSPQKKYEVTIKEGDEIVYQNASFAGVICSVEEVKSFGMDMEGVHQIAAWGHPMAQWYATDQINKWFKSHGPEFIEVLAANGFIKGDVEWMKEMFKKK